MGDMVTQSRALSKHDESKKDERLTTLTILISVLNCWAVLVTLVFVSQMSAPTNIYVVLGISVFFTIVLTWAYLGVPRLLQAARVLSVVGFVLACLSEGLSLYLLHRTSYLWGSYDAISSIAKILGQPINEETLAMIHLQIVGEIAIAVLATASIALAMYNQGFFRGRQSAKAKE